MSLKKSTTKNHIFFLTCIFVFFILIGLFTRFYNLKWGSPYFFHPDERNIANSISQLRFPNQLNPHFFAYGGFPIYVIYFTGILQNFFLNKETSELVTVSFQQGIFISRFYSAFLSIFLVILICLIVKKEVSKKAAFIGLFLSTTSVGFIQFAHFGTFEIWLCFFSTLLFISLVSFLKNKKNLYLAYSALLCGLLISIKISSLVLLLICFVVIFFRHKEKVFSFKHLSSFILFLLILIFFYCITSPYSILDYSSFMSSIQYEISVANGSLPVFYTEEFFNKIPVLFQLTNIYPFLINPILTLLIIPSFCLLIYKIFHDKKRNSFYVLLIIFFSVLFFSQAFLFTKWTRYIVPTLPFLYIIFSISFDAFLHFFQKKSYYYAKRIIVGTICMGSTVFSVAYFATTFLVPDTRIQASIWAKNTIPQQSTIMSEVYDLGILPFNSLFSNITLLNFYELDGNNPFIYQDVERTLRDADYIIIPSQRIIKSRLLNKEKFPKGRKIYYNLLNGQIPFKKIYETPCDILCKITYLGDPTLRLEQTANVFDRPTVFIFKNTKYE